MTVDERIVAALVPLGDPVESGTFTGSEDRYYVFRYTTLGEDFADDEPQHERYLVYVHLFAPHSFDSVERAKETKKALHAAGFSWPRVYNETDDSGQEIVFECEYADGVDVA